MKYDLFTAVNQVYSFFLCKTKNLQGFFGAIVYRIRLVAVFALLNVFALI